MSSPIVLARERVELSCAVPEARRAAMRVHEFLTAQGCGEADVVDCELAIAEACNNAISYAQGGARKLPIVLEIACDPTEIELRLTDHTPGFDLPETFTLPPLESENGRGLYLMNSVMDSMEYINGAGENVLVLRRKRIGGSL